MNPEQLARSGTEHAEQMALFCWANKAMQYGFAVADEMLAYNKDFAVGTYTPVPELKWLHAIPNAGARGNKIAASQLKAEGVKAGVADVFWPYSKTVGYAGNGEWETTTYGGIYVEMKRANGRMSDISPDQEEFRKYCISQNLLWTCAFGWRMARYYLRHYYEKGLTAHLPPGAAT
jgi:hypothetical protein